MQEEIISVSSKGQIVLPAYIREKLEIDKGRKLAVIEKDGVILMKPVKKLSEMGGIMKGSKLNIEKMIKDMRREWDIEL